MINVPIAEARHVAVMTAPKSMPASLKIAGFTKNDISHRHKCGNARYNFRAYAAFAFADSKTPVEPFAQG